MKKIVSFGFLLIGFWVSAQQILIPFKVGDKFGLVDEKDKIIVEPKYEELVWMGGDYFQASEKIQVKDKLETEPGKFVDREETVYARSVLYNGKVWIKPQPYSGFQVFPGEFFQARFEGDPAKLSLNQKQYENLKDKSPLFFLYNAKGENVHEKGFRRLEVVDSAGISSRNPNWSKFVLLFTENFQNQFQMCVFDTDAGKFKECLFQDVTDFKLMDADLKSKIFYISYKDQKGVEQKKKVGKDMNYFKIEDFKETLPERKSGPEILKERMETKPEVVKNINDRTAQKSAQYILGNDTLYYDDENGKRNEILLKEKIKPLFIQPFLPKQKEDLLYKKDGKFGFIRNGKMSEAEYDSLAYFGIDHYLACKKINTKLKCGTLDLNGKTVIPMEYDSIFGKLKIFELNRNSGKLELVVEKKEAPIKSEVKVVSYYLKTSPNITVYKDGKMGLLKLNNEVVLPLIYDEIGINGIKTRGLASHNYMIIKQDGNYGVVMLNFNSEMQQSVLEIIEPIFPNFPAFYFKDYYGKKGFHLFGLMDENGKFLEYASEIGRVYRKN